MISSGVAALNDYDECTLLAKLAAYDAFNRDNDPHGERDFGSFRLFGASLFWKIDYYDCAMEYGSQNQSCPAVTKRVLTVMKADEW